MKVIKMQRNSTDCLICGMNNPLGLKALFYDLEDGSVASVFTYKSEHQSYPERTHGGMITALLDELMGRTLWVKEPTMYGVTTSITITFRKAVPFGKKLKARAVMTHDGSIGFSVKGFLLKTILFTKCLHLKPRIQSENTGQKGAKCGIILWYCENRSVRTVLFSRPTFR